MFKRFLVAPAALFALSALAAADVNKATRAELEAIKGVGTDIAGAILEERKKGSFKDWSDFVGRVKGVGAGSAARLSAAGLNVGGVAFTGATSADKKLDKSASKVAASAPNQ